MSDADADLLMVATVWLAVVCAGLYLVVFWPWPKRGGE